MKKFILPIAFVASILVSAQEEYTQVEEYVQVEPTLGHGYNKWSVELRGGANKAVSPMTGGVYSKTPDFYTVDLGVRYMFNTKFGLKLDAGYNSLKFKQAGYDDSKYYRVDLQGVLNVGRLLNFETWTSRLNVLAHGGVGYANLENDAMEAKSRIGRKNSEDMVNLMGGLTGQVRITDRIAFVADLTLLTHVRQGISFDGHSPVRKSGITGNLWNATAGFDIYLGGKQKHADWYVEDAASVDYDLANRVANLEEMLKDSDNDGVADYLDLEPNTAPGAMVDTRGRTIDANNNGVPDVIEKYINDRIGKASIGSNNKGENIVTDAQTLEDMIKSGVVNVYFDYNSSVPVSASVGGIDFVVQYLNQNPSAKMEVSGYADPVGGVAFNKQLSLRRANAVKDIIVKRGINASRVNTIGHGIDGKAERADLARRVVFKIK